MRWMKEAITGQRSGGGLRSEFRDFVTGRRAVTPVAPGSSQPNTPKPSKKPLIAFLIAIVGIPYAMTKLIRLLQRRAVEQGQLLPDGTPLPPLDPSMLTFARALYPFTASSPAELTLKENEIVAIMGKLDPRTGQETDPRVILKDGEKVIEAEWWKGRTREGREGWFPRKWVEVLERRQMAAKSEP
ncbi:hypothetical protein ONZ45_g19191 [Pleurotus djamor]|nr:hypothetical protein ONZ45_g19191 [Pleurotus djamor]